MINQFNSITLRNDTGALWENMMISERIRSNEYHRLYRNIYFWRTDRQQEIDYLEEYDGKLYAYEFKWQDSGKVKAGKTFQAAYPGSEIKTIHKENFMEFVKF